MNDIKTYLFIIGCVLCNIWSHIDPEDEWWASGFYVILTIIYGLDLWKDFKKGPE